MARIFGCILTCIFLLVVGPAAAIESVSTLEVVGSLHHHVNVTTSPLPGYCSWEYGPSAGPLLSVTNIDGYGNMECPHPWFVNCDSDGLVVQVGWPLIESNIVFGIDYSADLTFTVEITEPVLLTAIREVAGDLDIDEHTLSIEYSDGTFVSIFAIGTGPDQFELDLLPGVYSIRSRVYAHENRDTGEVIDPYDGRIALMWNYPQVLETASGSWCSLKASFKR